MEVAWTRRSSWTRQRAVRSRIPKVARAPSVPRCPVATAPLAGTHNAVLVLRARQLARCPSVASKAATAGQEGIAHPIEVAGLRQSRTPKLACVPCVACIAAAEAVAKHAVQAETVGTARIWVRWALLVARCAPNTRGALEGIACCSRECAELTTIIGLTEAGPLKARTVVGTHQPVKRCRTGHVAQLGSVVGVALATILANVVTVDGIVEARAAAVNLAAQPVPTARRLGTPLTHQLARRAGIPRRARA